MKIGVKNFRVFNDMTNFDIRPLTILIGPNNSGKSSFTKLLLLLKNGYDRLDFSKGEHHLESFEKSLNWNSNSNELTIEFGIDNENLDSKIIYSSGGNFKQVYVSNNSISLTFHPNSSILSSSLQHQITLNFQTFLDTLLDNISNSIIINNLNLLDPNEYEKIREDYLSQFETSQEIWEDGNESIYLALIYHELIRNKNKYGDYLLYELFIDDKNKTIDLSSNLIEIQSRIYNKYIYRDYFFYDIKNILSKSIAFRNEQAKTIIQKELSSILNLNPNQIRIEESKLGKLLFKEKLFPYFDGVALSGRPFFEDFFDRVFQELLFENTEFIPARRGSQERISLKDSYSYSVLLPFLKSEQQNLIKNQGFLKEILQILKINGDVIIKDLEGQVSALYIKTDGKEINLADFGFGYGQLIPIILKLHSIGRNSKRILIIEEPEANLHPALQSKLADIFAVVNKYHPQLKIIIETHSEYLVRKMQYLVADKTIEKQNCIIHYFNADENVNINEPKVKQIEINDDGNLTDNFGPGFYDESTRLKFDLLKINKAQLN